MAKPRIRFSGTEYGLLMRLEWDIALPQLLVELEEHLQQSPNFFSGAQVFLEVGNRPVLSQDLEQLGVVLSRYGVVLQGIVPAFEVLERRTSMSPPQMVLPPMTDARTTLHVEHRTIRSGDKIAAEGNLIIIGDVNPGAEVIASYNIFVWGSLKGSAYAGVPNHEEAVIAALHLAPIQLRISGYIARSPEVRQEGTSGPELARIEQNAIIVETWERGRAFQKRG